MTTHTQILATAKAHDATIFNRMRGWAVETEHGHDVLMCFWFAPGDSYQAKAVFICPAGSQSLDLIAAHMNDLVGAGELTVAALSREFRAKALQAGAGKTTAELIMKPSPWIN